jgi:hypothetical protein
MAEVQESGPLVGQNLTDSTWRGLFGDEPGILGDTTGTAFDLTLPPASDSVEVGSASIDSLARVGGFLLKIPAGTTQSLEIPASTNAAVGRTDLIVARLDPTAFNAPPAPGPVRLHRLAGTEGSTAVPAHDQGSPGGEDMPLYAITRKAGQALTQAGVVDRRVRTGPHIYAQPGVSQLGNMPLGSTATRGTRRYSRELDANGTPVWVQTSRDQEVMTGMAAFEGVSPYARRSDSRMTRDGDIRSLHLDVLKSGDWVETDEETGMVAPITIARIREGDRPRSALAVVGYVARVGPDGGSYSDVYYPAIGQITRDGAVQVLGAAPGGTLYRRVVFTATWSVAT